MYVTIRPDSLPEGKLEPEWLLEALLEAGFSSFQFQVDQHIFDELVHLDWQYQDQEVVRCLAQRIEFTLETQISDDQMQAWVSIYPAYPGEVITRERLLERLAYAGICAGYIETAIAEILTTGSAEQVLIAQGQWPEVGQDASVQVLWQAYSRHIASAELICQVEPGDPLVRYIPPTAGKDGFTICGETLPAPPGRSRLLIPSAGAQFSEHDAHLLIATRSGCPILWFDTVQVVPLLILEQLTSSEGTFNYAGSLLVLGSIAPGIHMKVQGHLEVLGDIQAATLEIGGSLWVHGQIAEGSHIRVSGEMRANAIEFSFIECHKHVLVKNQVFHSHLRCGGRAQIHQGIGGRLLALESLHVDILGTDHESKSQLQLGLDDWFLDHQEFLNQEIQILQAELHIALKQLIRLRAQTAAPFYAEIQQSKIAVLEQQLTHLRDELAYIQHHWMQWPEGKEILIFQQVYPPCEVCIGPLKHMISRPITGPLRLAVRKLGSRKAILEEALEATPDDDLN